MTLSIDIHTHFPYTFFTMLIVDAHIHYSNIAGFREVAERESGCDYSLEGLQEALTHNNIRAAIGMGLQETVPYGFPDAASPNPMGLDLSDAWPEQLYCCAGINPHKLSERSLQEIEKTLHHPRAVGIKLYPGYYHFSVNNPLYEPVYELAAYYKLPVVIHSGDTFSEQGLLKYSHPLDIDELAVTHRHNIFVVAHMGDPWVRVTAEIVRKNANVYTDISGFLVGDKLYFEEMGREPLILNEFRHALVCASCWNKILFGTDWPLTPMDVYLEFVKRLIPEKYLECVMGKNALNIFTRISNK